MLKIAAEKEQVILLEARNTSGDNVLHVAVDANSIDVVQYLLKCGCDVNGKGAMKNTALHSAASKGYRDIVEVLLKVSSFQEKTRNICFHLYKLKNFQIFT